MIWSLGKPDISRSKTRSKLKLETLNLYEKKPVSKPFHSACLRETGDARFVLELYEIYESIIHIGPAKSSRKTRRLMPHSR